jgi:hypothetical protein
MPLTGLANAAIDRVRPILQRSQPARQIRRERPAVATAPGARAASSASAQWDPISLARRRYRIDLKWRRA